VSAKAHLVPAFRRCSLLLLATALAWSTPERFLAYGTRVAVLDPWSGTHGDPEAKEIGDSLRSYLESKVVLVPNQRRSPQASSPTVPDSCVDLACATAWGNSVGADRVVVGTIAKNPGGRSLALLVVDPSQGALVQILSQTSSDSFRISGLARRAGAELMGLETVSPDFAGPRQTSPASLGAADPAQAIRMDIESGRALLLASSIVTAGFLGGFVLAVAIQHSDTSCTGDLCSMPRGPVVITGLGTLLGAGITVALASHLGDLNARLRALQKRRTTDLQILPYVDPVHGSAGVFAHAGF